MDTLHIDLARALRAFRLELALDVEGVVALAGPSGAGTSTVLRAIAGPDGIDPSVEARTAVTG